MAENNKQNIDGRGNIGVSGSNNVNIENNNFTFTSETGEVYTSPIPKRVLNSTDAYGDGVFGQFLLIDRVDETDAFFDKLKAHIQENSQKAFFAHFSGQKEDYPHKFADILFLKKELKIEYVKYLERPLKIRIETGFDEEKFKREIKNGILKEFQINDTSINDFHSIWERIKKRYHKQHFFLNINVYEQWTDKEITECEKILYDFFDIDYSGSFIPIISLSVINPKKKALFLSLFGKTERKLKDIFFRIQEFSFIGQSHLEAFNDNILKTTLDVSLDKSIPMEQLWKNDKFRLQMAQAIFKQ